MANGLMTYFNESEDNSFTITENDSYTYVFVEVYENIPKVIIDKWNTSEVPTIDVQIDKVVISSKNGDAGHLTVISLD